MAKSDVNGPTTNSIYRFLRNKSSLFLVQKGLTKEVPWNFSKFLVSADTTVVEFIGPRTEPQDVDLMIEHVLKQNTALIE